MHWKLNYIVKTITNVIIPGHRVIMESQCTGFWKRVKTFIHCFSWLPFV